MGCGVGLSFGTRTDGKSCACNKIHVTYMVVSNPHQFPIAVDPADIDFMGHVNNASYLKWVQDAVKRYLWVATTHSITYRRPTFLEDAVIAHVILEKVQGARAFYETVIKRGEEVLAEVKSSWCCIDAETLRPARLARDLVEKFLPPQQTLA